MIEVRRRLPRRSVRRVWDGYDTVARRWLGWEYRRRTWAVADATRSGRTS
jgi:hypothetical protein